MMPIYYINLASAPGRRRALEQQLDALGLSAERVEAVTPADLKAEQLHAYCNPDRYRWVAPVELACSLSHLKVWQHLLEQKRPHALVLEDDVVLSSHLPAFLAAFDQLPDDAGLVKLEVPGNRLRARTVAQAKVAGIELRRVFGFAGGTAAYIISPGIISRAMESEQFLETAIDRALFDTFAGPGPKFRFLQADPALGAQASYLSGVQGIEPSSISAGSAEREATRQRSLWRRRAFAIRRWTEDNLLTGVGRIALDLAGKKKRQFRFLA